MPILLCVCVCVCVCENVPTGLYLWIYNMMNHMCILFPWNKEIHKSSFIACYMYQLTKTYKFISSISLTTYMLRSINVQISILEKFQKFCFYKVPTTLDVGVGFTPFPFLFPQKFIRLALEFYILVCHASIQKATWCALSTFSRKVRDYGVTYIKVFRISPCILLADFLWLKTSQNMILLTQNASFSVSYG